jgi:hypothetical protein
MAQAGGGPPSGLNSGMDLDDRPESGIGEMPRPIDRAGRRGHPDPSDLGHLTVATTSLGKQLF